MDLVGAPSFAEAVRWRADVPRSQGRRRKQDTTPTSADQGGFAPNLPSAEAALDFCVKAIEAAGFLKAGHIALGLDCAASEFFKDGAYVYCGRRQDALG